ncbi:MAG: nitroreductase [Candidatus Acetothermia bacterium]|jgi:nitroreductase|nr:nitroreductase [Candidatus Acetothermia bacterium]MDH7504620.1 nitroreductase [Candidatus Acetothermia bacterium]
MAEEVLQAIRERRSVRAFSPEPVSASDLEKILEAGRWAPSGKNTQPWAFILVKSKAKRAALAGLSRQKELIESAPVCLAVLLDRERGYDRDKDMQGIGACVENMFLAAHALGLGACWVGGVSGSKEEAAKVLELKGNEELVMLLLVGHPAPSEASPPGPRVRRPLQEFLREI